MDLQPQIAHSWSSFTEMVNNILVLNRVERENFRLLQTVRW